MSRCWIAQTFKQLQAENTANADLTHRTVSDLRWLLSTIRNNE